MVRSIIKPSWIISDRRFFGISLGYSFSSEHLRGIAGINALFSANQENSWRITALPKFYAAGVSEGVGYVYANAPRFNMHRDAMIKQAAAFAKKFSLSCFWDDKNFLISSTDLGRIEELDSLVRSNDGVILLNNRIYQDSPVIVKGDWVQNLIKKSNTSNSVRV